MFLKTKMLELATQEAAKHLVWTSGAEATKFTHKFEPVFGKGRFSWCAAFVTWCAENAGLDMPVKCPSRFGFTFAFVEGWQQWALEKGFWFDRGEQAPLPGDIVIFNWNLSKVDANHKDRDSHIGIFSHMDGSQFVCEEGNTGNQTAEKHRAASTIQGFIRIPDHYSFGAAIHDDQPNQVQPIPAVFGNDNEFVKAFQRTAGLLVDGDPGPKTYAALARVK